MIDIQGVTKHFDDVHALSKIDFSISKGEFITIVGPSGCGKSTLLRIIAGLVTPSEGIVNNKTQAVLLSFKILHCFHGERCRRMLNFSWN